MHVEVEEKQQQQHCVWVKERCSVIKFLQKSLLALSKLTALPIGQQRIVQERQTP